MGKKKPKPKGRPPIYNLAGLKVGGTLVAPLDSNLRMCAYKYGLQHGKKFTVNKTEAGLRCTRVA